MPSAAPRSPKARGRGGELSKERIESILRRFRPDIERPAHDAGEPTIKDARTSEHGELAYDETLQAKRSLAHGADQRIGTIVAGKYRLLRVIGEGGMGTVFEAAHVELGKRVAIKVLTGVFSQQVHAEASARFLREARVSSALESEHIAHVFDVGEDLNLGLYMVMELLKGQDLADVLHERGRLPPETAAGIVWQVSLALERAHAAGVVHRDLKPANVFLSRADDGSTKVRVLDFGIAKLVRDASEAREGITRRGSLVGTPQYLSPEQAQGLATVDARTDFYSLGALLFECTTGAPPFSPTDSYEQTILKIVNGATPRASSVLPDIAPDVDRLVSDLMARAPEARPASLALVRERLAQIFPSLPTQRLVLGVSTGRAPQPQGRTASGMSIASRRGGGLSAGARRAVVAGVLAGAAVLAVGVGLRSKHANEEPITKANPAAPPPAKSTADPLVAAAIADEREGRSDLACSAYERASETDPSSGIAALHASLCFLRQPQLGRVYFRRAWTVRASLAEREAGLLDAMEAKFQRDPVDNDEWLARMKKLSARFDGDARLHVLFAHALSDSGRTSEALAEYRRAIDLDPSDPSALELHADAKAYMGDFDSADRDLAQCLTVAHGAIDCIEERAWIDGEAGRCSAVEADGRRILSVEPAYAEGVSFVANALFAQGSPLAAIRDLLRRRRDMLPEEERAAAAQEDELRLAMMRGEMATAEQLARVAYDGVHASLAASDHGHAARVLVAIQEEAGHAADASKIAGEYLSGRDAWEPGPVFEDWAMADEPTPLFLGVRLHAGDLAQGAFDRERAHAVQRWESRALMPSRDFIWIYAYAAPTETAAEAAKAVAELPSFPQLPPYTPLSLASADVGRTFFLAGRIDDAVLQLERATHNCFPLDHPIESTRAHYFLGKAREAKHDTRAACAAYAVVRDRWGGAKPLPVTAQRALQRMGALGCGD